ncbi:hypothetical protein AUEXF2481DRAFT_7889 [Aureobasidium subglaciale EXF-2481]|uniref:peptidylprolyl isomerase n=1 Tax=Aureobasidium subglaciale (strain EXF-2481) TaxID=1043005 RepID=A0A074YZC4_AURSE|nr:uncharacterized protein AUEXF2481DRAFT_7889 [Aureobasidium subglaciale EXF-2481]KEQ92196.1 hypothetical protein AUEXF2481DRAFT_7889 [Aureobasidium subglaciale EXF-2481]
MAAPHRPRVFLEISIGNEPAGRLTIELFADKTPKTCENFRALCAGSHLNLNYALSPFHRIIDEFMVQGGDITRGDGTGGDSIYGGDFEDENLGWRDMDAAGLVCMANRGKATNSSQFFVTLDSCPHLNNKHTIFGRLVGGEDTLARMAKVQVDKDDKPLEPVLIARCGELERKQKAPIASPEPEPVSKDRGRRNRRGSSASVSRSPSPRPEKNQRVRRKSDHIIDENLRGRVRARSKEEVEDSPARERAIESDSQSPDSRYKRKRSPSPSRGYERKKASRESSRSPVDSRRRRRSLPNQYYDQDAPARPNDNDRRRPRDNDRYRPGNDGRQYDRGGGGRRGGRNSYRPPPRQEEGRLGGDTYGSAGAGAGEESTVKFKGRGHMKFREPDRRW